MAQRGAGRLLACLAAGVVLVGGCAEKHQANETLPSQSATSTAPELEQLGPADLPMPAEARTQDAAGAESALRYYLALLVHQSAKGGKPLRDLSRDCTFCDFLADRADADAAAGYTFQGGELSIESMSPPAIHGDLAEFSFAVSQAQVAVLDKTGNPVPGRGDTAISGLSGAAAMTWAPSMHAWLMTQLRFG